VGRLVRDVYTDSIADCRVADDALPVLLPELAFCATAFVILSIDANDKIIVKNGKT
jgi:hypothetical protein